MNDMVEVVIDSVRVSLMSPQRVVILRQTDVQRYLPIWIGPYEAESITVALQEVEISRPMTHDLLKNLFTVLNGKLLRVEIIALKADIYYGNIVAEADGKLVNIDSRPSDAVALALRAHVPILVNQEVMEEASIVPENDLGAGTPQPPADEITPGPITKSEEGLDVFEDFLKKLKDDQGDKDNPEGEDKPKPQK